MGFTPLQARSELNLGFRPLTEAEAPVEIMSPEERAWKAEAVTANPNATDGDIAAFMTEQARATPRKRGFRPLAKPDAQAQPAKPEESPWQPVSADALAATEDKPQGTESPLFRLPDPDAGLSFGQSFSLARKAEREGGRQPGTSVFKWQGKDFSTRAKDDPQPATTMDAALTASQPAQPKPSDGTASPMLPGAGFSKTLRQAEQNAARAGMSHPTRKPTPAIEPEGGAMKTMRALGQVYPVAETAANLVTQGVALPVAGLAGLGAVAGNALGLTDAEPGEVVHDVVGAMTYQPQTELGQHLTNTAMLPFEKLAEAGRHAGDATLEATGSPLAATAVDTAVNALPLAIGPVTKAVRTAVEPAKPMFKPTDEQVAAVDADFGRLMREQIEAETATSIIHPNSARQRIEADRRTAVADAMDEANTELGTVIRPRRAQPEEIRNAPEKPEGIRRLEVDETTVHGPTPQEFQELRSYGDSGLSEVGGELRALPDGHGAGAKPTALAGTEERNQGVQPREFRVDNAERSIEAKDPLPEDAHPQRQAVTPDLAPVMDDHLKTILDRKEFAAAVRRVKGHKVDEVVEIAETGEIIKIPNQDAGAVLRQIRSEALLVESFRSCMRINGLETCLALVASRNAKMADTIRVDAYLNTRNDLDIKAASAKVADDLLTEYADELRDVFTQLGIGKKFGFRPVSTVPALDARAQATPDPTRQEVAAAPKKHQVIEAMRADGPMRGETMGRALNGSEDGKPAGSVTDAGELAQVPRDDGIAIATRVDQAAHEAATSPLNDKPMPTPAVEELPDTQAAHTPDTLNAWAPGANYAPLVDDAKLPASTATTAADLPAPIRRENILRDFAKGIGTSIYEGRVKGQKRLGFFRPRNQEVRIKRANDIEVAAHEVAHLIDARVPEIAQAWKADKNLAEELRSVSYDQKSTKEGFAEAVRLYLTQPEELQTRAPRAFEFLEDFAGRHEYGPALKQAQADMTSWFGQDAINRARSKIGTEKPLTEHFDRFWDRFRQGTVDDLAGVYAMERDLTGKVQPNGPYESARLSRASASIADGAIRFGYPVKKPDGSHTFAGKGLEEILKPVSENLEDALLYFVGKSSNELMGQGRKHLFTRAEIDAMLGLRTPERAKAFEEYQKWNAGVLDFAEANGVINPQSRAMWQRASYLPFHRIGRPGEFKGAKPGDWSGVKALTGGTENLRDILGNMTQNAAQLIDKAVKNEARVKIADLADTAKGGRFMVKIDPETRPVKIDRQQVIDAVLETMGIKRAEWAARGQKLPKIAQKVVEELDSMPGMLEFFQNNMPPAGGNVVAVLRDGKPTWYEVGDPILYRALSSIDRQNQHWLINWLGLPKRIGQATITMTPDFWIANMARDTIMGSIMSQHGFKPVLDSLRGMRSRMMGDPVYKDYIANGGGLSSIYLDETKLRAKLEKFYTRQGIDYRTVLDTPDKLLGFIETLGDSFEMSTRLGEYKQTLAAGEHPRHAAYQGREVSTDFAMRGDSQALGLLYDTVMFLKPAVLSWDRLYRGLSHDPNRGAIAIKAGALALSSAALYLLNRDDPRYQDLPEWDRDANWHFFVGEQHFRYPKIWEIGAMASAAERTVERLLEENPEDLGKDFARILGATFNVNLMPQIIAPVYEQATNRNSFTKAPIETPGMENMQPFLRAKPGTSETMRALGMATAEMSEALQVNPARAEALVRGYFNTWAMYGLMLSDAAFFDSLPAKRAEEMPVVRRFYAQEPARHTKYEEQFYDLLEESKRLRGTLKALDTMQRSDLADRKEVHPLAGEADDLERAQNELAGINKDMIAVRRDPNLTPAEKRAKLDKLTTERNNLLKGAVLDSKKAQRGRGFRPLSEATP